MQIDPELLALRHADRPGCRFIGFKEVAIPVFFMNLRAVIIRERSLPTADEFLLRCVHEGIETIGDCAGFLGLTESVIEHRVVELRTQELLDINTQSAPARLVLTAAGAVAARQLSVRELRDETLPRIPIHGWSRRPIDCPEAETLKPSEVDERGLLKLRAVPGRNPEPAEIDARALTTALTARKDRKSESVAEVLAIRAVLKGVRMRYLPALMLQWQPIAGGQPQIGFVVDGRLDDDLERSFGAMKGSEIFADLLTHDAKNAEQLVEETLPQTMRERVRRALVSEGESRSISQTSLELATERKAADTAERDPERPETKLVQANRIKELEDQLKQKDAALGKRPRSIWTSEIKHLFSKSFQIAKERLIIVSAFVNDDVVDTEFIESVQLVMQRGTKVYLVIGDDNMAQGDNEWKRLARSRALASLEKLGNQYPDHMSVEIHNHHAKMLICDSQYGLAGSLNFLSFRGDQRRMRREQAILLSDPADIEHLAKDIMNTFFKPRPSGLAER